jgi:hypothetical protein
LRGKGITVRETGNACELCGRNASPLQKHHLIPRTRHKNRRNKKAFSRDEVKSRIAWLCHPCHKQIHALFSEKELEREYNTLEALQAHDEVQAFVEWIRKRSPGSAARAVPTRDRREKAKDARRNR